MTSLVNKRNNNLSINELNDIDSPSPLSKKQKINDKNLHTFKKKKLKHMQVDPKNNKVISKLETLLSHQNHWKYDDIENVFFIMHEHFEVSSIYGFQIEKGILDFVDSASTIKDIRIAALCMSRFANIKKSNGTVLLQSMLSSLLNFGKEYFDYFNVSSNLIDMKCSFKEIPIKFNNIIISDENIWCLTNRICFVIYTINYIFEINSQISLVVPYNDLFQIIIAFLSMTPKEIIAISNKSDNINNLTYFININLWKLFKNIYSINTFKGCLYNHMHKISEIMKLCLSENSLTRSNLQKLYQTNILEFLLDVVNNDGRYCLPIMSHLILNIINNISEIVKTASSDSSESILVCFLRVLNALLKYTHDTNIEKCINAYGDKISQIKLCLQHLKQKSIYNNSDFINEYQSFMKSTKLIKIKFDYTIDNYFKVSEELINLYDSSDAKMDVNDDNVSVVNDNVGQPINEDVAVNIVDHEIITQSVIVTNEEDNQKLSQIESSIKEEVKDNIYPIVDEIMEDDDSVSENTQTVENIIIESGKEDKICDDDLEDMLASFTCD